MQAPAELQGGARQNQFLVVFYALTHVDYKIIEIP